MSKFDEMGLKETLEFGIRSEIEAQEMYGGLAERDLPRILKNKLEFLKEEEVEHEKRLRELFKEEFPGKEPDISKSNAPDELKTEGDFIESVEPKEERKTSVLMEEAMKAEKSAQEYHKSLADKFNDKSKAKIANYLANMEKGHYEIIKNELEGIKEFEQFDEFNDLMHAGP